MSYARARRHYRVAQKENAQAACLKNGIFITKAKRNKLIAIAIVMIIAGFVKGLVLGHMLGKVSRKGCNL